MQERQVEIEERKNESIQFGRKEPVKEEVCKELENLETSAPVTMQVVSVKLLRIEHPKFDSKGLWILKIWKHLDQ